MKVAVRNRCSDFDSYRAARVKSLFNAESGCNFDLDAELPIESFPWSLGVIVGPSGSGKSSIGTLLYGADSMWAPAWASDRPIIDEIAPTEDFNKVTAALAAVGLGTVPAWLRPYCALSNGERFRADLARVIAEMPQRVVIDEFTSVIDRQIARMGALAFAKSWKREAARTGSRCVLLTCHYDVLEWLEPDWIFDTAKAAVPDDAAGAFVRGNLRRPRFELEIHESDWAAWPRFAPHYYLTLPKMVGSRCYVGTVNGEPVAHVAVSSAHAGKGRAEARASRLVIMPEWQGAGIGLRFLNAIAQLQLEGAGRIHGRSVTTIFHTTHPGLCAALRRDPSWCQVSAVLHGQSRRASAKRIKAAESSPATRTGTFRSSNAAFGGHFRAVQGFRYLGPARARAAIASNGRSEARA